MIRAADHVTIVESEPRQSTYWPGVISTKRKKSSRPHRTRRMKTSASIGHSASSWAGSVISAS
jgi:hypothetical protein